MIPYEDHILPMSETPLNKALAALSTRLEGINAPTREVWDPWQCPPEFLRALAHAFSVDLWNDKWTDTRKRSIIANAVRLHREKGTLAGARDYLEYVDAALTEVVTPPQRVFAGPSLTREEREDWLSSLPQLRVWRIKEPGTAGLKIFSGGFGYASFLERRFAQPSTAIERLKRRARWVVGGQETDTRVSEFGSYFRLHIKSTAGQAVFSNRPAGGFFLPSTARTRLLTIQPRDRLAWRSSVGPSLEPVNSEPERVTEFGTRERRVFNNTAVRSGYFQPSSAWRRIFLRFAVHDGRKVNRRKSISYMGVGRYGFPAHTAMLRVSMPGHRPGVAAGEGVPTRKRFWLPHDGERLFNARSALTAAARASDRLLIAYARRPAFTAGLPFYAGVDSFIIGQPKG